MNNSITYYENSIDLLKEINQEIGGYKVRELTPAIIQSYFNKLDSRTRKKIQVFPKSNFKETLKKYGYTFTILRNHYNIQSCTLSHALNGRKVSKKWSVGICQILDIPFETLFEEIEKETPYAYRSNHKYKSLVRTILSLAKKNRLISDNYAKADYIDFPKAKTEPIKFMDDEQAKKFYETLAYYPDLRVKAALLTFLLTGCRRGEVAGLEWKDVDFNRRTISINRSIIAVKRRGLIEKETKTENSVRTISIPYILLNALKEYKEWQDMRKNALGDYMIDTDKIFTQNNGKNIYPSTFYDWLDKVLIKAGLEHFSLHSIRHTNITIQLANGIPLVTVSARAGHSKASTTSDIYAHFIRSSDITAANQMDKMFNPYLKNVDLLDDNQSIEKSLEEIAKNKIESVNAFRKAKIEMKELGFETYDEYLEYLEYKNKEEKKKQIVLD